MNKSPRTAQTDSSSLDAYRRAIQRLPLTMRPALNQQLAQWETLFPFEQSRAADFMKGVETFSPSSLSVLTASLRALETKMGVKNWEFSETRDTIENASQLARSEYYGEWRREVQRVFDLVNAAVRESAPSLAEHTRLMLLVLPRGLPIDPQSAWKEWDPRGHEIRISGDSERFCELTLKGWQPLAGISATASQPARTESSDNLWLIDADAKLSALLPHRTRATASCLGFEALKPFRDRFLAELNKAPKSIRATDEVVASLRRESWDGWGLWPEEISSQPRLRKFVIDLFLSGNGALIFSNAFVEWAICEALRRARPQAVIARFGMRYKPKLFTSIAIFENQQRISSLPDVVDPENSAIDAAILARYAWLAASRYPEHEQTICLCISECRDSAYMILPERRSSEWNPEHAITPEELYGWLRTQLLS